MLTLHIIFVFLLVNLMDLWALFLAHNLHQIFFFLCANVILHYIIVFLGFNGCFILSTLVLRSLQDMTSMCRNLKLNFLSFVKNWWVKNLLHCPLILLQLLQIV